MESCCQRYFVVGLHQVHPVGEKDTFEIILHAKSLIREEAIHGLLPVYLVGVAQQKQAVLLAQTEQCLLRILELIVTKSLLISTIFQEKQLLIQTEYREVQHGSVVLFLVNLLGEFLSLANQILSILDYIIKFLCFLIL